MSSLPALLALLGCSDAPPPCTADIAVWEDIDGDGFGGAALDKVCKVEPGQVEIPGDCDDNTDQLSPVAVETCDGIDNDCDGQVDDGANLKQFWYDHDGDGYGGLYQSEMACSDPGEVWVANSNDCDDMDPAVNPKGQEVCGRVDEDCDGYIDESDDDVDPSTFSVFFADKDGDAFGDRDDTIEGCRLAPGYVVNANDCNDNDATITWSDYFADADGDGYGDPATLEHGCQNPPPGTVDNDLDCDDTDPSLTYESDWFVDPDGDGWGEGLSLAFDCIPPDPEAVNQGGDCNEADPLENPGAPEDCVNGIDDNCNFLVDDDDPTCVPPCADAILVGNTSGSTLNQGNDFSPSCCFSSANDYAYAFTATTSRTYVFNTIGSAYDTALIVYDGCGGLQLGCNDDWYGLQSRVSVFLNAGQTVIVVVDGYSSGQGNYNLNIL